MNIATLAAVAERLAMEAQAAHTAALDAQGGSDANTTNTADAYRVAYQAAVDAGLDYRKAVEQERHPSHTQDRSDTMNTSSSATPIGDRTVKVKVWSPVNGRHLLYQASDLAQFYGPSVGGTALDAIARGGPNHIEGFAFAISVNSKGTADLMPNPITIPLRRKYRTT